MICKLTFRFWLQICMLLVYLRNPFMFKGDIRQDQLEGMPFRVVYIILRITIKVGRNCWPMIMLLLIYNTFSYRLWNCSLGCVNLLWVEGCCWYGINEDSWHTKTLNVVRFNCMWFLKTVKKSDFFSLCFRGSFVFTGWDNLFPSLMFVFRGFAMLCCVLRIYRNVPSLLHWSEFAAMIWVYNSVLGLLPSSGVAVMLRDYCQVPSLVWVNAVLLKAHYNGLVLFYLKFGDMSICYQIIHKHHQLGNGLPLCFYVYLTKSNVFCIIDATLLQCMSFLCSFSNL
ncbi:hypothetical protein Hanom_Chr12g01074261 [Helianthus anomalus]